MIIRQVAVVGAMVLERMKKVEIVFGSNVLNGKLTRYIMKNGSIIIILMSICCHVINIRCMRLLVTPIILFRIIGV